MSSKGGKRKDRKDKKKAPRKATREEYESQIVALNGRLAALRTEADKVGCVNDKLKRKMETTHGDHKEVCSHLSRVIEQKDEQLAKMQAVVAETERLLGDEAEEEVERTKELERRYLLTMNELGKEVELKTALLNSIKEYQREQQAELGDYERLLKMSEQKGWNYKEILLDVDQKRNVDMKRLREEILSNLRQLSAEFLMSADIREAIYKRNLIRRNTELHKQLEKQLQTVILLHMQLEKEEDKTRVDEEEFRTQKMLIKHLKLLNDKKHEIIEKLGRSHANLEAPYVELCRYKMLYESSNLTNTNERFNKAEYLAKIERLTASAEHLAEELRSVRTAHAAADAELCTLVGILNRLEIALQLAVDTYLPDSWYSVKETPSCDMLGVTKAKRGVLLDELVDALAGFTDEVMQARTPVDPLDVYTPGDVGFVAKDVPKASIAKDSKSSEFEESRNASTKGIFTEASSVSGKIARLRCL